MIVLYLGELQDVQKLTSEKVRTTTTLLDRHWQVRKKR